MYPNLQHRSERAISLILRPPAKTIEQALVLLMILLAAVALIGCSDTRREDSQLAETGSVTIPVAGKIETVALFNGPMPTGVAISKHGRLFVNFPRWGDQVDYTVAEVIDGKTVPFPNANINAYQEGNQADHLVAVQSVVVDPKDRLWILDTASIKMGEPLANGPKLICVDLKDNQVVQTIHFPENVALKTTYLNDVRFDLNRGKAGYAFITDSSDKGANGIIVVDLATGESWRKLNDHPSTKADPNFVPSVEGEFLMVREAGKPEEPIKMGSDGIAIDVKKGLLFYCPLASHKLYSVKIDALVDRNLTDEQVAQTIRELPQRDFASDGLECAPDGTLILTDYEHNAIRKLTPDGTYETIASDARMIWPDSMSVSTGGQIYFTANQLNRQPRFHGGEDLRQKPYAVFRAPSGVKRIALTDGM